MHTKIMLIFSHRSNIDRLINLHTGIVKEPRPDPKAFHTNTMALSHTLFMHTIQCQPFILYHHFIIAIYLVLTHNELQH